VGFWMALALAAPVPLLAQGIAPPSPAAQAPITFRAAMDLAISANLELAAVRRARAVREAEVRAAGQWANPEFSAEITRDSPHGDLAIGYPVDIGGVRSRRVALAKEALAKTLQLRDTQVIVLAQTVGFPKK